MTKLNVTKRDVQTKLGPLRKQSLIPAIVYSKGAPGVVLAMPALAFEKVYNEAGESSLVDLVFEDGATKKVLIHEVQQDAIKKRILHVDFFEVDLSKKVTTNVELEFINEAPIVKVGAGIVVKQLHEIEVECLPSDLIKHYTVDLSVLTEYTSAIHIRDLQISDKLTILNDPGDVVVNVSEPRIVEAEVAPAEGAAAAAADVAKATASDKAEGEQKKEEKSK